MNRHETGEALPPIGDPDEADVTKDTPGDFAEEHSEPSLADEPSTEAPDESVPEGRSGMDE